MRQEFNFETSTEKIEVKKIERTIQNNTIILFHFSVTYPEFFGGHRFQQGVWGQLWHPQWVHGKALVGAKGSNPLEASGI